jgi:hypothetical protein
VLAYGAGWIRMNGGLMPGESFPPPYGFPEDWHLCEVREIHGNYVKFCILPCKEKENHLCPWHEHRRTEDIKKDKGKHWNGLEVTFPNGVD